MKQDQKEKGISENIAGRLLSWYDEHKRILPWRENRHPYRIWISEIMLQQTRVEAVKPYYDRFLEALPGISDLAAAREQELLKLWEGLGYYNRVRNLQKAAVMIMEEYNGEMPEEYELLLRLPGIGEYTAGAIASIAFSKPVPAVDGNVMRILARVLGDDSDISDGKLKKEYAALLGGIMPKDRPGDFNQALMELGATVCIPTGAPKCEECPIHKDCAACREGLTGQLPYKKKAKERAIEKKTVLLIRDGDHVVIQKRPVGGLLAGMYEYPMFEGWLSRKQALTIVKEMGYDPMDIRPSAQGVHIFTHKEWHMHSYFVKIADTVPEKTAKKGPGRRPFLIRPEQIDAEYPVPSAYRIFRQEIDHFTKRKRSLPHS